MTFDNLFSGDPPAMNAAAYVIAPITALVDNDYETVDIERLDLTIEVVRGAAGRRRSSASGSTIRGRAPAAPCR